MNMYEKAGVDVAAGDAMSEYAARKVRESWGNAPNLRVSDLSSGNFRGPRPFDLVGLPEGYALFVGSDGAGTKTTLQCALGTEQHAAWDVVAMCGGDQTRYGVLPLGFVSVLDVSSLGKPDSEIFRRYQGIFDGLGEVAKLERIALLGGETAELGDCIGSPDPFAQTRFNIAGFMIGAYHPDYAILGNDIKPWQDIVALEEPHGFRSNGLSAVRKAFAQEYGSTWWYDDRARSHIEAAASPSTLYDAFLAEANGWYGGTRIPVSGIAHVTGGGMPGKLASLLRATGHSAVLDSLYDPPAITSRCGEWLKKADATVTDRDFYSAWPCGQGVLAVMDDEVVPAFIAKAAEYGIKAKACGEILPTEAGTPSITIKSRFSKTELVYEIR